MVVTVPIEYTPPKYVTIVNTLQARIEDGTYQPGAMLPSETVLMGEFNASRPVVVRALEILRQDGWLDTQQGRGRFVRAKPAEARALPAHAAALLDGEVAERVRVVDVADTPAPARAAAALNSDEGAPIVVRRRLVGVDGLGPVELGVAYIPVALADGTDVRSPKPLAEGLLRHLAVRKGIKFDHVTERVSARQASIEECALLGVEAQACVLTALLVVHDRGGAPVFALDLVVPPTRHEFEGVFPIA